VLDVSNLIQAKSDQLNADDLISGPITVTVQGAQVDNTDQPLVVHIGDNYRPFKPCLSMRRVMAKFWSIDANNWSGQSMTLYNEPSVRWAGKEVGGIRISHMTGINRSESVMLSISKGKRVKYTIQPLTIKPQSQLSQYDDNQLNENLSAWKDAINSGKATPGKIIKKVSASFLLSEQQIETINSLAVNGEKLPEVDL